MAPHDSELFEPSSIADWLQPDDAWFERLTSLDVFTMSEKVHLVRLALQRQWICDIRDEPGAREALDALGFFVATEQEGYLIVSGSGTFAEYLSFRSGSLSLIETGIFYGYPPSAVLAHARIVEPEREQKWPRTVAEYFLGGVYSACFPDEERSALDAQWLEIKSVAPKIAAAAELAFTVAAESEAA
jgi:hypothetical protein